MIPLRVKIRFPASASPHLVIDPSLVKCICTGTLQVKVNTYLLALQHTRVASQPASQKGNKVEITFGQRKATKEK